MINRFYVGFQRIDDSSRERESRQGRTPPNSLGVRFCFLFGQEVTKPARKYIRDRRGFIAPVFRAKKHFRG
jgi:hypothetical protein